MAELNSNPMRAANNLGGAKMGFFLPLKAV
jgi:hypothetical protein